ncbi:pyrimidine/purine nucleoside phosphorylase [Vibrio sp. SM6]|uniref:Pyrimidine/purine nucleoside phosphorylase n=1 Tax=Vibrio agarilyticus TaxID=2726741 RepID=A0A7X8TN66_9VIBR|nr:pyrimidine/purine nucleoside phosphorylase [Vibrio agarilyticus]NLS11862.1 pyrimidine/purine nucleoside phosphorylase [Vibrio agarilyticus]
MAIKESSYFEGNVKSLGYQEQVDNISVGVMLAGEYTFGTAAPERMSVIKGELTVKLPGHVDWQTFSAGQSFEVDGDSSFNVKVAATTAYLCEYL